jgi:hypothetical protein
MYLNPKYRISINQFYLSVKFELLKTIFNILNKLINKMFKFVF